MTDRVDELQRLHEAVAKTLAAAIKDESRLAAFAYARHNLANAAEKHLPALLRVARAAKDIAGNVPLDIDERIRWLEVQVGRAEWAEMREALGELERPADRIG
jgi:hypothetical protein